MNRNNWSNCHRALVALCLVLALANVGVFGSQETAQDGLSPVQQELDRLAGVMAQVIEPVREMAYVAAQGCNATALDELELRAQTVLNMLEGSSNPLFDASVDIPLYVTEGILPVVNAFAFTEGWYDPKINWPEQREMLEAKLEDLQGAFADLSQLAQQVLVEDAAFAVRSESMAQLCRLLETEQQRLEAYLALYGYEIRLSPDDSLQEAIDGARDGAILYLWPHTYNESIEISKNINLIGTSVNANPLFESSRFIYGSVIDPIGVDEADSRAVHVHSESPIVVTLRDFTIRDAGSGILVTGEAFAELDGLTVRDSGTGLRVTDGGHAEIVGCEFLLNSLAISAREEGVVAATDCNINDNERAIRVSARGSGRFKNSLIEHNGLPDELQTYDSETISVICGDITLEECIIRNNYGVGVEVNVGEYSVLHMTDCQVTGNEYGVTFQYGYCYLYPVTDTDARASRDESSHGTVTGWNNEIPGPDETNGNREAALWYCCDIGFDPSFLLEPKPEDD